MAVLVSIWNYPSGALFDGNAKIQKYLLEPVMRHFLITKLAEVFLSFSHHGSSFILLIGCYITNSTFSSESLITSILFLWWLGWLLGLGNNLRRDAVKVTTPLVWQATTSEKQMQNLIANLNIQRCRHCHLFWQHLPITHHSSAGLLQDQCATSPGISPPLPSVRVLLHQFQLFQALQNLSGNTIGPSAEVAGTSAIPAASCKIAKTVLVPTLQTAEPTPCFWNKNHETKAERQTSIDFGEGAYTNRCTDVQVPGHGGRTDVVPVLIIRSQFLVTTCLDHISPVWHLQLARPTTLCTHCTMFIAHKGLI